LVAKRITITNCELRIQISLNMYILVLDEETITIGYGGGRRGDEKV
jgi:hypothetical protein